MIYVWFLEDCWKVGNYDIETETYESMYKDCNYIGLQMVYRMDRNENTNTELRTNLRKNKKE